MFNIFFHLINYLNQMNMSNEKSINLNDFLFDSIEADDYNLTSIYLRNYSTIKIKRHPSKQNKKLICVLGVLVNKLRLKIVKEMISIFLC